MLEIKDLHVSYGGIQALRGVSLTVPEGKIVTLIGANGAGKSTLMRTISGLVKAQSGSILWNGQEILGKPIDQIVASGIAMSPEGRRVFADLTVLENLKIGAYLRKDKAETEKDLQWVFKLFPRLEERSWQSAGTLSGGEQQMLAVGRALMSKPKLLMLDEPSLGLAPIVVREIFDIIRTVNQQGITVLLNEQNANMALKVADYAYVLETGTLTLSGTGTELLADESVKAAYLGKSAIDFCFQNDLNALRFALSISRGIYNFICGLETTAVVSRPLFHEKGRSVQCILSSKIYSKKRRGNDPQSFPLRKR